MAKTWQRIIYNLDQLMSWFIEYFHHVMRDLRTDVSVFHVGNTGNWDASLWYIRMCIVAQEKIEINEGGQKIGHQW